jgi:hypothetical protein
LGGQPLAILRRYGGGVDHAQWVAEVALRIGENTQHRDIDAHEIDCTASG